jgi:hypothetical protein
VASLLLSLVDRGKRGRPCSRVLLADAGRSPRRPVVGPLDLAMPRPDLEAAQRGHTLLVVVGGRTRTAATAAPVGVVAARPVRGGLRSYRRRASPRWWLGGRRRFFQWWGLGGRRAAPCNGGGRCLVLLSLGGDGQWWPAA